MTAALQKKPPTPPDKPSPHSTEAEAGVIASVLLDSRMLDEVMLVISAADFLSSEHRRLFEIITSLHNANKPFDFLIILEKLKTLKIAAERDAAINALMLTTDRVPTAANAVWYAKTVRAASIKREIINTATHLTARAQEGRRPG